MTESASSSLTLEMTPGYSRHNVESLGVDLSKLDFVVISHRHSDHHTTGSSISLDVNPTVPIYAAREGFGMFGGIVPPAPNSSGRRLLPSRMRYFDGVVPSNLSTGNIFRGGNFVLSGQTYGSGSWRLSRAHHFEECGYARASTN